MHNKWHVVSMVSMGIVFQIYTQFSFYVGQNVEKYGFHYMSLFFYTQNLSYEQFVYYEYKWSILYFRPEDNLFSLEAIRSMCTVEATHLRSPPIFKELCESKGPADCCPGWSLGGYIAVLNKRSSCFSLEV